MQDDENQTAYLRLPENNYWWYWYGSEIEANAYYLKLLSQVDPKGDMASRLVKYLLNNRKHATYWNSTRDTALCVEALADYLQATGEDKPDMTVEVWSTARSARRCRSPPRICSPSTTSSCWKASSCDGRRAHDRDPTQGKGRSTSVPI